MFNKRFKQLFILVFILSFIIVSGFFFYVYFYF